MILILNFFHFHAQGGDSSRSYFPEILMNNMFRQIVFHSCFLMFLVRIAPRIMEVWNIVKMPRPGLRRAQGSAWSRGAWLSMVFVYSDNASDVSLCWGCLRVQLAESTFTWLKSTILEVANSQLGTVVKSKPIGAYGAWPQSLGNPRFPCCPRSRSPSAAWV